MPTVLLVGGAGFLGLHLINEFHEAGWTVHVFDIKLLPTNVKGPWTFDFEKIQQHLGDLTSEEDVCAAIEKSKPDVLVHSASPVHGQNADIYKKINVDGTANLLDCCETLNVNSFIYTSSAGVVFNGDDLYGVNEDCRIPKNPMDAYNDTKARGEDLVLKMNNEKLRTTALRPAGIFGPGDRQMIPGLRLAAQRGQQRIQLGSNLNLFDVTYAGNVAYAHVLAAQKLLKDPKSIAGQKFFITNDSPIYFWSFAKAIWKHDGYEVAPRIVIPKSVGVALGYLSQYASRLLGKEPTFTAFRVRTACSTRYYDISRAKEALGYAPKWTLEEALKQTLKY